MTNGSRRGRVLVALFAMVCVVASGCDSSVVPPSTAPGPQASLSANPMASGGPSSTDPGGSSSAGPSTPPDTETPAPDIGLPELSSLAMPGFAAYEQVQMIGSEFAATVYTALSCDALAGWLQAADWRLDGSFAAPFPSTPPAEGAVVPPSTRWLVISRPGDAAVAKLVSDDGDTGCRASVSRLSEQQLSASGAFTTTTHAMAYQMICLPETVSAHVVAFYLADDGTRAMISAKVPLALGEQNLLDAELRIGPGNVTLSDIAESFAGSLGTLGFLDRLDGVEPYEGVYETSTGTAVVTSIDPLVATVTLGNFISEAGASQSVSAGIRCDLPIGQLERAAIAPPVTPAPTVPPAGTMTITIGSTISQTLAGPAITCSFGIVGADTWEVRYSDPESDPDLSIFLFDSPEGASLSYYDFSTDIPTTISIDEERTGGHLDVVIDDGGDEVEFAATGVTHDGDAVDLAATCAAIQRADTPPG